MKIGELAKRSGLSAYTIRYYERIGLLPYADRDRSSRRDYDPEILVWIEFLGRLKTTGMPIRDMLRYAALRKQGDATGPERQAMLEAHRDEVRDRVAELQQCLLVLDQKIAGYAGEDQRMTNDDADTGKLEPKPAGTRQTRACRY
ncbi:MerR family transcriptional regulator [Agrobacterium sp. SORGH_AS 787]|uniref:MerR family transcriptional regulator n=1 Tax=Agrobacterium sp. SORGH_AS 787 TaxID=3041775 RepID=UPI00277FE124|nr:DNA-binding transcriptional MerR regulator [Rhizobium sp. SORGH_AS_0787]